MRTTELLFALWKRPAALVLTLLAGLSAQNTWSAQAVSPKPRHAHGQVIVQFKAGVDDAGIAQTLQSRGVRARKHLQTGPMKANGHRGVYLLETGQSVEVTVEVLNQDPSVEFAEPNWIYVRQATANDPYAADGSLWGVYGDTTSPANIYGSHAAGAWAAGYTGTNTVYVGVIDEGVQWQHPDLISNIWSNHFDPVDGLDNDGNGYADDVRGWDFYSGDNSVYDAGWDTHGTHVAGTIGAAGGNGIGVAGVNWRVSIVPAKFLGPEGGTTLGAIQSIDYMVDLKQRHGLNIVALNNSWGGGGYSQSLHAAIIRAARAGILFIAAAGNGDAAGNGLNNDAVASYPSNYDTTRGTAREPAASYNSVISVAAINSSGSLAQFSNHGTQTVHLGAPGVNIWSTVPQNAYAPNSGTSMATPHVTGAAALYASAHPAASAAQIRTALLGAVTPTPSLAGKTVTGGRLNVGSIIAPGVSQSTNTVGIAPAFSAARVVTNRFRFTVKGPVNQRYEIQSSTNLISWATVATFTNNAGTMTLVEQQPASNTLQKFYRAIAR